MTLISARHKPGEESPQPWLFLQCDGCLPPHLLFGSPDRFRRAGWELKDEEHGPHYCAWCRGRFRHRPRRLSLPEARPSLPNLIVIGAAKCGTTSLHGYLAAHPEIHMSASKELNFFQDPYCEEKLDTYATFFDEAAVVRGESSTIYSCHPLAPHVADRIHTVIPEAKLIYLVRDPVERAVSHYAQKFSAAAPLDPPDVALGDTEDPYNQFIAASRYGTQLEQYLACFPRSQVLVIDRGELLRDRDRTLRRIFRFLEVDDDFDSPRFRRLANTRAGMRRKTRTYRRLSRNRLTATLRRRLPSRSRRRVFGPVKHIASIKLDPPAPDEAVLASLRVYFRPEVERLRRLTGQDFASWQI